MKFLFNTIPVDPLRNIFSYLSPKELVDQYWLCRHSYRRRAVVLELCKRCDAAGIHWQETLFKIVHPNLPGFLFDVNKNNENVPGNDRFEGEIVHAILEAMKSSFSHTQHQLSAMIFVARIKNQTLDISEDSLRIILDKLRPKTNDYYEAKKILESLRAHLTPEQLKKQVSSALDITNNPTSNDAFFQALSILNMLEPYLDIHMLRTVLNSCIKACGAEVEKYTIWEYIPALFLRVDEAQLRTIVELIQNAKLSFSKKKEFIKIITGDSNQSFIQSRANELIQSVNDNMDDESLAYLSDCTQRLNTTQVEKLFQILTVKIQHEGNITTALFTLSELVLAVLDEEKRQSIFRKLIIKSYRTDKSHVYANMEHILSLIGSYSHTLNKENWTIFSRKLAQCIVAPSFLAQNVIDFLKISADDVPEALKNQLINTLMDTGKPSFALFLLAHRVDDERLRSILLMRYPLRADIYNSFPILKIFANKIRESQIDVYLQWMDEEFKNNKTSTASYINFRMLSELCQNANVAQRRALLAQAIRYNAEFNMTSFMVANFWFRFTYAYALKATNVEKQALLSMIMEQTQSLIDLKIQIGERVPYEKYFQTLSILIPAASAEQKALLNFDCLLSECGAGEYRRDFTRFFNEQRYLGLNSTKILEHYMKRLPPKPDYIIKLYSANFKPNQMENSLPKVGNLKA